MYYTYVGLSGGLHEYSFTLKLYMRCNSGRTFPNPAIVSIFDKTTNQRVLDLTVDLSNQVRISLPTAGPCINNPPDVCYEVGYYNFNASLPPTELGYVVSSQVNYRINGLANTFPSQVGATYTCDIPGTFDESTAPVNNSARFTGSDLIIICASNFFSYSFAAEDGDGDELRYSFCSAYSSSNGAINGSPAGEPPYMPLPYALPEFSESAPLGPAVNIDAVTGLITGIAPAQGAYVVTVCVEEIRGGKVIAIQRKDIQVNVADCDLAAATLQPDYMLCGNSQTLSIANLATSMLITTQDWLVSTMTGELLFASSQPQLTYTFLNRGTYLVKLIVNRGQECSDSTEAMVYVYPGFEPGFSFEGICLSRPSQFLDLTTTVTGTVNTWRWDFGEPAILTDNSFLQHPSYTYPSLGPRNVRLIVTNTDGCRDTVVKTITIIDKPPLEFAFRDTLICLGDQLQLQSGGMGTISWTPTTYLVNPNSHTPLVSPVETTVYFADLNSDGCLNRDSVVVRVVDHVSLSIMADTAICSSDTIMIRVESNALKYSWSPAEQFIDPAKKEPLAITPATTNYQLIATIGGCSATDLVTIQAIPYPLAELGNDTMICFGTTARLNAVTDGNSWVWTPAASLSDPGSLSPLAQPPATTSYIFLAYENTRGCPKPGRDTLVVTVLEPVQASAGNDTAIVVGQSLQLQASGGSSYAWSPPFGLSSTSIADPVALFREPSNHLVSQLVAFNEAGCSDTTFLNIRVFATAPMVFVPTAFTPNNDGRNDLLQPIAAGIARIEYFEVYNRWGQVVYRSTAAHPAWDGRINGQMQGTNTYVWQVKAIDYKGTAYYQKGTVTLIQ